MRQSFSCTKKDPDSLSCICLILFSIKNFIYPIPGSDTGNHFRREVVDCLTKAINNLFQCLEHFIAKSFLSFWDAAVKTLMILWSGISCILFVRMQNTNCSSKVKSCSEESSNNWSQRRKRPSFSALTRFYFDLAPKSFICCAGMKHEMPIIRNNNKTICMEIGYHFIIPLFLLFVYRWKTKSLLAGARCCVKSYVNHPCSARIQFLLMQNKRKHYRKIFRWQIWRMMHYTLEYNHAFFNALIKSFVVITCKSLPFSIHLAASFIFPSPTVLILSVTR